jgi:hypothetical protein
VPVNGGSSPVYQWKKNGVNAGTGSTFTTSTLSGNDVITCELTGNAPCAVTTPAVSNAITMTVTPVVVPALTISASPGNTVCAGTPVTFSAAPVNGGAAPAYSWKINGNPAGTASTLLSASLANADVVTCTLTSSNVCAVPATANSNSIAMTVNPAVTPTASISANPGTTIGIGQSVTFTAAVTGGGTAPVYQWIKNGGNVGTNSNTYTSSTLADGDVIAVEVTGNDPCSTIPSVQSNTLAISISNGVRTGIGPMGLITVYPNPGNGQFTISGTQPLTTNGSTMRIEIRSITGSVIYREDAVADKAGWKIPVSLGSEVAAGNYLLQLSVEGARTVTRLSIVR